MSINNQENGFESLVSLIDNCRAGKADLQQTINELKKVISDISTDETSDIRDEMDGDMEESGMSQGEIESCLNHWSNKYYIFKR